MDIDDVIRDCVDELHEAFGHPNFEVERKKIDRKLDEAKYNPGNVRALADTMLALLLIARSWGFSPDAVFGELGRVAKESRGKKWKRMPDGTYQAS
jgi:hypothetical protein